MIPEHHFAGRQIVGAREQQEDSYAFSGICDGAGCGEGMLVVVADGMGGHRCGERASLVALEAFLEGFHAAPGPVAERLRAGVTSSNRAIAGELARAPELEGMGTTLVAAAVTRDGVQWISVGDSLLYLVRRGVLGRLNEDHSFRAVLNGLVEAGEITPEKAARHPLRNLLQSALLGKEIELVDAPELPVPLEEGDLILAASDGLQTLDDAAIAEVIFKAKEAGAAAAAADLVGAIRSRAKPKQDNATVALLRFARAALASLPPDAGAGAATAYRAPSRAARGSGDAGISRELIEG
jgi:protein phosphatase